MPAPSLGELATQATFIFRGRVERPGATTMAAVPATENIGVVRVEAVLAAPPTLGDLTGREVTVQFTASAPEAGSEAILFTRPWLYGDSLAVIEVGRTDEAAKARRGRTAQGAHGGHEVVDVIAGARDRALQERLSDVDAAVSGRVVNTRPVRAAPRITEHDPGLQVATIAVDSVEMGEVPQPTVNVLFASSLDVMWFQSPKLRVGRAAIWLLQRGTAQVAVPAPATAWTCLDPRDELSSSELDRLRNSVAAIGRQP